MGNNQKNPKLSPSEIALISKFQATVCRNDTDPCNFWNKGCTHEKHCRKFSAFKRRELAKDLANKKEEQKKQNSPYVKVDDIKDAVSDTIEFLDILAELNIPQLRSKKIKISALKNRLSSIIRR